MKKSKFYVIVGLILPSLFFFSSCGEKKDKSGRTDTRSSGTISFVADESFSPIIEELREQFDIAAARAVAPADVLSEYLLPYVRMGGYALCWKGPALKDELESGRRAAHLLGGSLEMPVRCPVEGREWEHLILPIRKVQSTPKQYPRKAGVPKQKPLGSL
jgi:hypothetical protein